MPTIKATNQAEWKTGKPCLICDEFVEVPAAEAMFYSHIPIVCDECKRAMKELKERLKNETLA